MGQWGARAPLVIDQLERWLPDVHGAAGSRPGARPGDVDQPPDQQAAAGPAALPHQARDEPGHARELPRHRARCRGIGFGEHEILDLMTFERVAQRMVFQLRRAPFVFVNTHLHHPPEAQQERVEQLKHLLAWLDRDARRLPTVIARRLQRVRGAAGAGGEADEVALPVGVRDGAWARAGEDVDDAGQHVRPSPHGTLDYIFVSDASGAVVDAGLAFDQPSALDPNVYPSDHLGLYAVLEL